MKISENQLRKIIREEILAERLSLSEKITAVHFGDKSSGDTTGEDSSGASGNGKIIIFGDSQTGGEIGRFLSLAYSGRILGEIQTMNGSGVSYWIGEGWMRVQSIIEEEGCPEAFLILLGSNPDGASNPKSLVDKILSACSNAKIHWSGGPPSTEDTDGILKRNKEISKAISSVATFYDPLDSMTAEQVGNTPYPSRDLASKYVEEQLEGIV